MKRTLLVALFSAAAPCAFAAESRSHSAARLPDETFTSASARYRSKIAVTAFKEDSPYALRAPFESLDHALVPAWPSQAVVNRAFAQLREARFVFSDKQPEFARRSSWLYPDDGCFARAALAADNLTRWGYKPVAKVFVFGDLDVRTPNSPDGHVEWWYHVAPIVRLGSDLFVLDPAIEPAAPMKLAAWLAVQSADPAGLRLTICNANSYVPEGACRNATPATSQDAMSDQQDYLADEWNRQTELGRDPALVLGDAPIWK